jgi:hypothetical protein
MFFISGQTQSKNTENTNSTSKINSNTSKIIFGFKTKTYILKVNLKRVRDPLEKMNVGHAGPMGYHCGWAWAGMAALGGWASPAMDAAFWTARLLPSSFSFSSFFAG